MVKVKCNHKSDLDPNNGSIYTVEGKGITLKRPHEKYLKVMLSRGRLFEKILAYWKKLTKGDNECSTTM